MWSRPGAPDSAATRRQRVIAFGLRRSPNRDAATNPNAAGLPSLLGTSAWGRRILGTQLASWAQLRHDTILYAKQSYSAGVVCEFPDAAVDPYPEFYAAVGRFAEHGYRIATLLEGTSATQLADAIRDYFMQLRDVAGQSGQLGAPPEPEWIQDLVPPAN